MDMCGVWRLYYTLHYTTIIGVDCRYKSVSFLSNIFSAAAVCPSQCWLVTRRGRAGRVAGRVVTVTAQCVSTAGAVAENTLCEV